MKKQITEKVISFCRDRYGKEVSEDKIVFQPTKKEFEGDYTIVVFPLAKVAGKAPDAIAAEIGDELVAEGLAMQYNVVKGFLNLVAVQCCKGISESGCRQRLLCAAAQRDRQPQAIRLRQGKRKVAADDDRVFVAKHKQTAAPRTYPQQSARRQYQPHTGGKRLAGSQDQYRKRQRHTHLQVYAGVEDVR